MSYIQNNYLKISKESVLTPNIPSEKYNEYRAAWSNNPQNGIVGSAPLNVDIELTNACNLKCPYCARTNQRWGDASVGFMDKNLAKQILDELSDIGCYCAKFNLRGEPLLHKDIVEILEHASHTRLVDYYFNTNGTLLTEHLMREFIRIKLPRISISVAGWDKESYEKSQFGADYYSVRSNIQRFMELKKEFGALYPKIRLQIVLTPEVLENMEKVIKTWKELGDEFGGIVYRDESQSSIDDEDIECENFKCNFLWQRLVVLWNGDVYPCLFHGVKQNDDIFLGNIQDSSIQDLWLSEKSNMMRQLHNDGKSNCIYSCRKCSYRDTEVEKIISL